MRRHLVSAVLPLFLIVAPPHVRDTVVITGRISDATTGTALGSAQVTIRGTQYGALSRDDGTYRLSATATSLRNTEVTLVVRRIGYAAGTRLVHLTSDSVTADFALTPSPVSLADVVVTGAASTPRTVTLGASITIRGVNSIAGAPAEPQERGARRRGADREFNTESYDRIVDNPFLASRANPLSTFSIDVDRASYSNVRRFVTEGQRPPKDAVRIEELVNYFSYDYPDPSGIHPFSVTTEIAPAPWQPLHMLVRIGLQAKRIDASALPPNNLVFLIDVSGSMGTPNKLPLVKQALRLLVAQLREEDRVAIVVYAGNAGLVLPSTSGDQKHAILDALDRLEAGGSTAGGAGIALAYEIARQNYRSNSTNRVILATDGDFNVGPSSDAEMERLIEEKRRQGTFLSVLGFGMGNVKDAKMEKLADKGNGNYAYIDGLAEARKVLVDEMVGTLCTVAKDVKLQVEFNPEEVAAYRLIGYENRMLRSEDFDDDAKDAGEIGAGHSVTALYELIPVGIESPVSVRGLEPLRYQRPGMRPITASGNAARRDELMFVKLRYKLPDEETSRLFDHPVRRDALRTGEPSADFAFATAVAAFGMILRDSEYKGSATLDAVIGMARRSRGEDIGGYRADFVRLVESVRERGLLVARNDR